MSHENEFDSELFSLNEGPLVSRGLLWESVLQGSLQSGDPDRIAAAIDLAEAGGAGPKVLARSREELCRLAVAALANALTLARGEPDAVSIDERMATLTAAMERAEELSSRVDAASIADSCSVKALMAEASRELRRLADVGLKLAIDAGSLEALHTAVRAAERVYNRLDPGTAASGDACARLADGRRRLRRLREKDAGGPFVLQRAGSTWTCGTSASSTSDSTAASAASGGSGTSAASVVSRESSTAPSAALVCNATPGSSGVARQPECGVEPMTVGRVSSEDLLEAGLAQTQIRGLSSGAASHTRLAAAATSAGRAREQECTLQ